MRGWDAPSGSLTQWARLILSIRLLVTAMAVVLLIVHRLTDHDGRLIAAVCVYGLVAVAVAIFFRGLTRRPLLWALDIGVALTLVVLSGDWRSPFFLLSVTTLVTPSVSLSPRRAVVLGLAFSAALAVIAHFIGPDPLGIDSQSTVETLATHLTLPVLVCFGSAAVADALRRLRRERLRSERLAIDAERRRIAWELHDSAKARVHAAHLVLSALRDAPGETLRPAIDQVLGELDGAAADMDTSLEELRAPLEGRDLAVALRERITAVRVHDGPAIELRGSVGALGPLTAAHAYRITAEAIINAARHAHATRIDVALSRDDDGAHISVTDDGRGMPAEIASAGGLRYMQSRARTIDADLRIGGPATGTGTVVELHIPAAAAWSLA